LCKSAVELVELVVCKVEQQVVAECKAVADTVEPVDMVVDSKAVVEDRVVVERLVGLLVEGVE